MAVVIRQLVVELFSSHRARLRSPTWARQASASNRRAVNSMTVELKTRIYDDVKSAMRARDKERLGVLRLITAAIVSCRSPFSNSLS